MSELKVIHLDMDAFYAAVEQRDHPQYRGKPVVVGGDPKGRGVVSTASYEARKFGVHSAMSCKRAAELCPGAIFLPVDMDKYKKESRKIHYIFRKYTSIIEPISIDEAFLEIEDGNAVDIAKKIKEDIYNSTGLTASVGVSYNKFVAKLASDMKKPDGFTVITYDDAQRILPELPIRKIWGVGEKTEKELNNIGIFTVKDLLQYDHEFLLKNWGRRAHELLQLCQGIDYSPVQIDQEIKSMGEETTLKEDTMDLDVLRNYLKDFSLAISGRMSQKGIECRTITVKIKYNDFKIITRGTTLNRATNSPYTLYECASEILDSRVPLVRPVRLIGLQVSNLIYPYDPVQISFL
ncbi:MAG: DNA polymerase IV [Caldicoprobacterales bacterium]|jgi:DNA polymerase-4|nr:DNA polymerase IV [Clostridiales bacterium]